MKDIEDIVREATDSFAPLRARHEAFSTLVLRFQDMAFGCAFAVLGDAYLAEDTAQEAFVVAWQKLTQLREPAAFAGWFKRIVLSQCNRVTRAQRLQIVPFEQESQTRSTEVEPQVAAERGELLSKVLQAINALPENERLVTTLFYVNGYTQVDIGEFLEVPVSTVNKRLYSARQRLKGVMGSLKDDLRKRRPSRDGVFSNKVKTSLRPLNEEDWPPVNTLASTLTPEDSRAQQLWRNRRREFDESRYFRKQYVVEDAATRQILAYGAVEQTIYLPRYSLLLLADPRWLELGVGEVLLERLISDSEAAAAVTLSCRVYASENQLLALFKKHGFEEISRVLDLRLTLSNPKPPVPSTLRKRLEADGISISTLAEERQSDPRYAEKLYELTNMVREDDPARPQFKPPRYNVREALLWLQMPYVLPEGYFIAKRGDEYIGVTDVSLFNAMPGAVTQGFTGVRREFRRRGVATALKIHSFLYAQSQGYELVQTFNHPAQGAMLALNRKLGFETLSERVTVEKCLRKVVKVEPQLFDSFAGLWRDDARPDLDVAIRNEAGRLTAECAGQKVELFPASETNFFVKQFYGEATFTRDEDGEFTLLEFQSRGLSPESAQTLRAKRIG